MNYENAFNLFLKTSRPLYGSSLSIREVVDLSESLNCLRQSLSCYVCYELLKEPCSQQGSTCQHYVCKSCIGGKLRVPGRASCSWCKAKDKFLPDDFLVSILKAYKALCAYLKGSSYILMQLSKASSASSAGNSAVSRISKLVAEPEALLLPPPVVKNESMRNMLERLLKNETSLANSEALAALRSDINGYLTAPQAVAAAREAPSSSRTSIPPGRVDKKPANSNLNSGQRPKRVRRAAIGLKDAEDEGKPQRMANVGGQVIKGRLLNAGGSPSATKIVAGKRLAKAISLQQTPKKEISARSAVLTPAARNEMFRRRAKGAAVPNPRKSVIFSRTVSSSPPPKLRSGAAFRDRMSAGFGLRRRRRRLLSSSDRSTTRGGSRGAEEAFGGAAYPRPSSRASGGGPSEGEKASEGAKGSSRRAAIAGIPSPKTYRQRLRGSKNLNYVFD